MLVKAMDFCVHPQDIRRIRRKECKLGPHLYGRKNKRLGIIASLGNEEQHHEMEKIL